MSDDPGTGRLNRPAAERTATALLAFATVALASSLAFRLPDAPLMVSRVSLWIVLILGVAAGAVEMAEKVAPAEDCHLLSHVWLAVFCGGVAMCLLAVGDAASAPAWQCLRAGMLVAVGAALGACFWRLQGASAEQVLEATAIRMALGWLAVTLIAAAGAALVGAIAVTVTTGWFERASLDAAFLAAAPLLVLASSMRRAAVPSRRVAPPRGWLELTIGATVAIAGLWGIQAWLWRYPGGQATGGAVALYAVLVVIVCAQLIPRGAPRGPGRFEAAFGDAAGTVAVVVAIACAALTTVERSVGRPLAPHVSPYVWAWGYRTMLGLAALYGLAAGRASSGGRAGGKIAAGLAYVAAILMVAGAHRAWLADSGLAPYLMTAAGGFMAAGAIRPVERNARRAEGHRPAARRPS